MRMGETKAGARGSGCSSKRERKRDRGGGGAQRGGLIGHWGPGESGSV